MNFCSIYSVRASVKKAAPMHPQPATDTGAFLPIAPLPALNATGQRAIEIRVAHLEAFQAARHWEIERLYERLRVLADELLNDQQQLRCFRDLLFMRGRG